MRVCPLLVLLFSLSTYALFGQKSTVIQVMDENGGPLIGATLTTNLGTFDISDASGKVILDVDGDSVQILIRYVGYTDFSKRVVTGITHRVQLEPSAQQMQEITISGSSDKHQLQEITHTRVFSMTATEHLPYLLGQQDPIKLIQTQSGVSTGTDGNNGYFVRGGGIDQNAIELDHMEFYNTNHLLGFFSMFNAHAVDHAEFIKSGYPAQIGGRLSSMLQLHSTSVVEQKTTGTVSAGFLALDACVKVPVVSEKSGIMVAARRSYIDLITQNLMQESSHFRKATDYRFQDVLIKYDHRISSDHQVFMEYFQGSDHSNYQSSRTFSNQIAWSTHNYGVVYNWLINDHNDIQAYANGGLYQQSFQADISTYGINLNSYIQNWKSGIQWTHSQEKHELTLAAEWINRVFRPSQVDVKTGEEVFALAQANKIYTSQWSLSGDDTWQLSSLFKIGFGLRVSGFIQYGPFQRIFPDEELQSADTVFYSRGEIVNAYMGLEPRLRMVYLLPRDRSLKFSYDKTFQYIHLSPLSSVSLPTDLWVPSTSVIKPQMAHQFSLGYYQVTPRSLSYHVEIFGKLLRNQMEWANGVIAGYSDSPNFDDDFVFGKGHSYGMEFSGSGSVGKITGEINYTLSRTFRIFPELNGGMKFPAKYDRIHDLNVTASYSLKNWKFSLLGKLASGTALTLPTAKYLIGERVISEYTSRNGSRMPLYHRMDVAAVFTPPKHPSSKWIFSVYNVYNRKNPYFIYFDVRGDVSDYSLDIDLQKVSLFPVLPSVSYEFHF